MKKLTAVFLALAVLFSMAGCALLRPQDGGPAEPVATEAPTEPPVVSTPEPTVEPTAVPTEAPTAAPEPPADAGISRGVWTGSVYSHECAGFTLTVPAGWVIASDDTISAMLGISAEMMGVDGEDLSSLDAIYDMLIHDPATGNNILIIYSKLDALSAANVTDELILNETLAQMYAQDSVSISNVETGAVTLGDAVYQYVAYDMEGYGMVMRQYSMIRKHGEYVVNLTVTAVDRSALDSFLPMFQSPA